MTTITITKKGAFLKNENGKRVKIKNHELQNNLQTPVELEEGLTFGTFMKGLSFFGFHVDFLFAAHLGKHPIELFMKEALSKRKKPVNDYTKLVVEWRTDVYKEDGKNTFWMWPHFAALNGTDATWNIALCNLSEIAHLPIVIDDTFTISELVPKKKKLVRHVYFEGVKTFTLQEFIGAILHEITYHGFPAQRDELAARILNDNDDATENN